MIKKICKNINVLKTPSKDLKETEIHYVNDLIDTLNYHKSHCVGMALNMIGINKNAIAIILENNEIMALINPVIIMKKNVYEVEEGCLSLEGVRKTKRYKKIEVKYLDMNFNEQVRVFEGFEAQIIQHEVDHLFGIII